eukprot:1362072-Amorphochlora_amoeboformis.AAC.1
MENGNKFSQVVGRLAIGASTSDLSGGPTIDSYTDLGIVRIMIRFKLRARIRVRVRVFLGA